MSTPISRVRFPGRGAFSRDLETAADAYFEGIADDRRDVPRMFAKTAILLTWFVGSWTFFATSFPSALASAVSLGFAIAAVGMCRAVRALWASNGSATSDPTASPRSARRGVRGRGARGAGRAMA